MDSKKLFNIINQKNNLGDRSSNKDFVNIKLESLFQKKFSIENLVKMIKNIQFDYISQKPSDCNFKNIKQILSLLKENLAFILNKKNKIYDDYHNENEKKKKEIKKIIFQRNYETVAKKIDYLSEKEQLKELNFQIENEIENTDFLIKEKNKLIENGYQDIISEHNYKKDNDNKKIIFEIMNNQKTEIKKN